MPITPRALQVLTVRALALSGVDLRMAVRAFDHRGFHELL
jgi:hypothetical protein